MPTMKLHKYGGPGGWNDPDYLLLGYLSPGRTRLSPSAQYSQVSLWSLVAAPLILGGDVTRLDDFTLNLLCNDEVIDVDQDPLGKPGHRVAKQGDQEVWARPLEDGSLAVGLFNRNEMQATVTAKWSDLGVQGKQRVRDLWRQKDLGTLEGQFSCGGAGARRDIDPPLAGCQVTQRRKQPAGVFLYHLDAGPLPSPQIAHQSDGGNAQQDERGGLGHGKHVKGEIVAVLAERIGKVAAQASIREPSNL